MEKEPFQSVYTFSFLEMMLSEVPRRMHWSDLSEIGGLLGHVTVVPNSAAELYGLNDIDDEFIPGLACVRLRQHL